MEMYIGYVDMIENIFEVHTYTIEYQRKYVGTQVSTKWYDDHQLKYIEH